VIFSLFNYPGIMRCVANQSSELVEASRAAAVVVAAQTATIGLSRAGTARGLQCVDRNADWGANVGGGGVELRPFTMHASVSREQAVVQGSGVPGCFIVGVITDRWIRIFLSVGRRPHRRNHGQSASGTVIIQLYPLPFVYTVRSDFCEHLPTCGSAAIVRIQYPNMEKRVRLAGFTRISARKKFNI